MIQTLLVLAALSSATTPGLQRAMAPAPHVFDATAAIRARQTDRPSPPAASLGAPRRPSGLALQADDPPPQVGDFDLFWIVDFTRLVATGEIDLMEDKFQIEAELVRITDNAYLYIEPWLLIEQDMLDQLMDAFETTIYPTVGQTFGAPPNAINHDPRITILVSTFYGTSLFGATAAGYFDDANQYTDTEAWAMELGHSNEREMIYINEAFISMDFFGPTLNVTAKGIFAHEYQHLTHWARDPNQHVWLNEACSEYAMVITGYGESTADHAYSFAFNPTQSLIEFDNAQEQYGAVLYFTRYLADRFEGSSTISDIAHCRLQGVTSVDATLRRQHGLTFRQVYHDWSLANMLDNSTGPYAYQAEDRPSYYRRLLDMLGIPITFFSQRFAALNGAAIDNYLFPWSTEYYLFRRNSGENGEDFYVDFEVFNPPQHVRVTYLPMLEDKDPYGVAMFLYGGQTDIQLDTNGKGRFQIPTTDNLFSIVVSNTTAHVEDLDDVTSMTYRLRVREGLTTGGIVVDQAAPATVTDLTVEQVDGDRLLLAWTAPGDDGYEGWASDYDLRYSDQTLTTATFTSAVRVESVVHPRLGGLKESHWVTDLPETTSLTLLLRVEDDAGNVSWSNTVSLETGERDRIAPATIDDIRVVSRFPGGLQLGWTAPGDDGHDGQAQRYDIRWSTRPITDEWTFRRAWVLDGPTPSPAGETDTVVLGGVESLTVYVAIRTTDEMGNLSDLSAPYRYDPRPFAPATWMVY